MHEVGMKTFVQVLY